MSAASRAAPSVSTSPDALASASARSIWRGRLFGPPGVGVGAGERGLRAGRGRASSSWSTIAIACSSMSTAGPPGQPGHVHRLLEADRGLRGQPGADRGRRAPSKAAAKVCMLST